MAKDSKSKWPKVPENYETLPINQQLLLTQNASDAILKHLKNGPNGPERDNVPRAIAEALLCMVSSVVTKAIDQPDNKELLAAMLRLEQPIKRIEGDVTAMKNSTETAISKTRGPMGVWAKGLSVASPPLPQSTLPSCSSQPAPPPELDRKEDRQVTIKIKDKDTAHKFRVQTPKQLQNFIETRLKHYPMLKSSEVEVAKQLKSGDLQLLMKTGGAPKP